MPNYKIDSKVLPFYIFPYEDMHTTLKLTKQNSNEWYIMLRQMIPKEDEHRFVDYTNYNKVPTEADIAKQNEIREQWEKENRTEVQRTDASGNPIEFGNELRDGRNAAKEFTQNQREMLTQQELSEIYNIDIDEIPQHFIKGTYIPHPDVPYGGGGYSDKGKTLIDTIRFAFNVHNEQPKIPINSVKLLLKILSEYIQKNRDMQDIDVLKTYISKKRKSRITTALQIVSAAAVLSVVSASVYKHPDKIVSVAKSLNTTTLPSMPSMASIPSMPSTLKNRKPFTFTR
jgi:hypothetical protein